MKKTEDLHQEQTQEVSTKTMSFTDKLINAKKEIGAIAKDSKNPFYKSKYFDINQLLHHVEPILLKHGLLIIQPIIDNKVVSIIKDSSDSISSELALPNLSDPQKLGSCITYYRRYTLASLLALQAEDDDANKTIPVKPQIPQPLTAKPDIKQLSAEQFKKAMESDAKGIKATLEAIKNGKIKANTNQINKLTIKLEQL